MSSSLQDRLRALRRTPVPVGAPEEGPPSDGAAPLRRLEQALLGTDAEDGVPLKERLQRLVAAATRDRRGPRRVDLDELVPGGRVVDTAAGSYFLVEQHQHLDSGHGSLSLSRFHAVDEGAAAVLTGEDGLQRFRLSRAVFLDTETTGLAGGTGTAAFLIGVGYVEGDRFYLRQYVMRDYDEEPAQLRALAADLEGRGEVVSYNGKNFDLPLLEARYRLNRLRFPLEGARHLDLLHPARRLWKARLESCRLQALERALLGVRRAGDVSGEEIPQIYFDYVRQRDGRALARVLEHNRLDVVSLAALAILALQWLDGTEARDPLDVYSLGRVLERADLHDRAGEHYRRLARETTGPVRVRSLLRLASRAKRRGELDEAARLWEDAAAAGDWWALRELAVHHEHRRHDLAAALSAVETGLACVMAAPEPLRRRAGADFQRRRERILAKIGGRTPV